MDDFRKRAEIGDDVMVAMIVIIRTLSGKLQDLIVVRTARIGTGCKMSGTAAFVTVMSGMAAGMLCMSTVPGAVDMFGMNILT